MDFSLSQQQEMIRNMVREFAQKEIEPHAAKHDEEESFPTEIVKKMAAQGLLGMMVPPEYGGTGLDSVSYTLGVEEISRVDASCGIIMSVNNSLYCGCTQRFGTDEQKKKFLPPVAKGESIGAYALTEPGAGSDPSALKTTAIKDGDDYILNGEKIFVTNGGVADYTICYARTDPEDKSHRGISAFIIQDGMEGYVKGAKEKKLGIRASDTISFTLKDCRVPEFNRLGEEGKGFKIALATLDDGRIGVASQALGIAQGAFDHAVDYSKQREQFGQTISNFQAIQWKLADMAVGIHASRLLIHRAASLKDAGERYSTEASMAKLFASDVAMKATREAIQIWGGYGFTKEYPLERYYRDAKITELYEGTSEIQRLVIARAFLRD